MIGTGRAARHVVVSALAGMAFLLGAGLARGDQEPTAASGQAREILADTGVRGGLIVHVGCGDGRLTAALRASDRYVVHGLDRDPKEVAAAREHIRALGLYGKVAVDHWRGDRLPYTDNLVNLLVARSGMVSDDEIKRVLAPGGVACVRDGGAWTQTVKPRPAAIDEWTHALHGPDNNAVADDSVVGPPFHLQWVSGPRWARSHDHLASTSVVVSSGGRLFSIIDEGPIAAVALPAKWSLVAHDAFSGVLLWKRPVPLWEGHLRDFRSGPSHIQRRLVGVGDRVYVTLGYGAPVTALDAATGETLKTYAATHGAEEVLWHDGVLYLVLGDPEAQTKAAGLVRRQGGLTHPKRRVYALKADSGEILWRKDDAATAQMMPMTLAVGGGRVFFHNSNDLVCLDAATGEEQWHAFRPVATRRPAWSTPTLVVYGDVVLCGDRDVKREVEPPGEPVEVTYLAARGGGDAPPGKLIAYSAADGKELWSCRCRETYNAPVDVLIADGLVWSGNLVRSTEPGITEGRDPRTGEVKKTRPPDAKFFDVGMPHHRCHRNRATSRYLVLGRAGVEFIDLKTGEGIANHWVRGVCQYGVVPANGLLYAPPHSCACYIQAKLNGFNALAPKREAEQQESVRGLSAVGSEGNSQKGTGIPPSALERGPAYDDAPANIPATAADDWPTYRHDAVRSGATKTTVPADLTPAWERDLGGKLTAPVVAAGKVYVAQVDEHTLHALDAADGKPLWRYTAGGRVDSPPTVYQGMVLFGSADGWVYCLRAADGELIWRFRAAPEDRRVVAYDQIESVWPVHGAVLVQNGEVLLVAGRSSFLDGGMVLHRLDARTGKTLSSTVMNSRDPKTGCEPARIARGTNISGGSLPDVLSSDGQSVFMRHVRFDLSGVEQKGGGRHLYPPAGFVDDTWWHRTYWMYGGQMQGGYGGWPQAAGQVPAGRILVMDGETIYGFGRSVYATHGSHVGLSNTRYRLFAAPKDPGAAKTVSSGSLIRIANTASLNPAGKPLTVEAWVKPDKPEGVVLARGAGTHGYALILKGGVPQFVIRADKKLAAVSAKAKVGEGWTHLAGVMSDEKDFQIYVNGELAGSAKTSDFIPKEPGDPTEIGADDGGPVGDYADAFPYAGLIDEVRVYHRALTAEEILQHASKPETVPSEEKGLVLLLSFDKGDAADGSGKKNDGAPTGVKPAEGRVGQAMRFTGEMPPPAPKQARPATLRHLWTHPMPLIVRGMVLADDRLFVAGPPAPLDEKDPPAALGNGASGLLLAVATADGKTLAECHLASPPVFDGLVAAQGRLYVSTSDGNLRCLAGPTDERR